MTGELLAILAALCFGLAQGIAKYCLSGLDALRFNVLRGLVASLLYILALVGVLGWQPGYSLEAVLLAAVSGVIGSGVALQAYYTALKSGKHSKIIPLANTHPFFSALISYVFLGEPATLTDIAGMLLITAGITLLVRGERR